MTEDPKGAEPRVAVHAAEVGAAENGRLAVPLSFYVYTNYASFIARAEIQIYHGDDIDLIEPLAVVAFRPGVFSRVAGALALHGIEILGANLSTADGMAIERIRVAGGHGLTDRPQEVVADIERALRRELAITARLLRRAKTYRFQRVTTGARLVEPAMVVDNDISASATVLEVRGPDSIGFLYRVTRAFVELDLDIAYATVQTLGDDVVDTFYVTGPSGAKVTDPAYLAEIELAVLSAIGADA